MLDVTDFIKEDLLLSSLREKLGDDSLVIKKITSSELDLKGAHFVSAVGEIHVTYESQGIEHTLPMFVKFLGDNTPMELIETTLITLKEIRFYDTLLPVMQRFLQKSSANNEVSLNFPTCYYTNYDGVRDVIVLEDLTLRGFQLWPLTRAGVDLAHAKLAFKTLADFHSVSFVMMKKTGYPNVVQCPHLKETLLTPEGIATFKKPWIQCLDNVLDEIEDRDGHQEIVDTMRRVKNNVFEIAMQTVRNPGPFKVIGHRDCWNSNMMFRHDENGTPIEIILFDMQVTSITSLCTDLNNYLFLSTTVEFRKEHTMLLLRHYYDIFSSNVASLGIDELGFTFDMMVEDFKTRGALILGFLATVVAFPMLDKNKMMDPGDSDNEEEDSMEHLNKLVADLLMEPEHRESYFSVFLDMCEEMKYSIDKCELLLEKTRMANVVDFISEELLQSSLRKKLNDNKLEVKKIESPPLDLTAFHSASAVAQIQVSYLDGQGQEKMLPMFVKYVGDNKMNQKIMRAILSTVKELNFYDVILPAMNKFLGDSSAKNIVLSFPECYYANLDGERDVIAMEDLSKKGFRMEGLSTEGHNYALAKLVVKAAADFHSVSFAMIRNTGFPNLEECPYLEERVMAPEGASMFKENFVNCFSSILDIVDDDEHREMMTLLRRIKGDIYDIGISLLKNPGPFKVVAHRDFWSNNMMFRYEEDTPVECLLLDPANTSLVSLTVDLNNYFTVSTSHEFRKKHLTELLRFYYDTFEANVKSLGLMDGCGFTFDEMLEDYRRRSAYLMWLFPAATANPMFKEYKTEEPENAEADKNLQLNIIEIIKRIAKSPKWGEMYKSEFFNTFEELKYSIEHSGF